MWLTEIDHFNLLELMSMIGVYFLTKTAEGLNTPFLANEGVITKEDKVDYD